MASMTQPRPEDPGRIASLDGLRALSILLVVALHTLQRFDPGTHASFVWYAACNGRFGVSVFFEISGFLITTLLMREWVRCGSISLRSFYLRRAFRILPPLYVYIGVVFLLSLAGRLWTTQEDLLSSLFFFHNFSATPQAWSLEHLWSISVEEQFYLVWPLLLVLALRLPPHWARRTAAGIPILILAISPPLRVLLGRSGHPALHHIATNNINLDFLMFGCLVALLQGTPRFERVYDALSRPWWAMPATLAALSLLSARFQNYFDLPLGYTLESICTGIFLLWCTRNAPSALGRLLNWRPVAWIGILSFSIYLWQTLFLHERNASVFGKHNPVATFPGNLLAIVAAAAVSYYFVEQPSLRLRGRLLSRSRRGA